MSFTKPSYEQSDWDYLSRVFALFEANHKAELESLGFYRKYSKSFGGGGYYFGKPDPTAYIQFFLDVNEPGNVFLDIFCENKSLRSSLRFCESGQINLLGHQSFRFSSDEDFIQLCTQIKKALSSQVLQNMISI